MLTIRKTQMKEFEKAFFHHRFSKICDIVQKNYPEKATSLGRPGVEMWVTHAIETARVYHIESPQNIERFIHVMFILNRRDFHSSKETAWAGDILRWENADENLKLAAIEKRIRDEQSASYHSK